MEKFNESLVNELVDIIYKKIEKKYLAMLNTSNVEFCYNAIVNTVNEENTYATVSGSFGELELPNSTGVQLSINDKVKVYSNKGDMIGAYIGVKL